MGRQRSLGDLTKLTDSFSAAAINPLLWEAAMDTASQITGSVGATLLPISGNLPIVPMSQSVGDLVATYVRDGWHLRDERQRGVPTMIRRGVMCDLDFANPDEFSHHPYYQEFLAPFDLRWFVGVKVSVGSELWCLAIQRSVEQGPLSPNDLRKLGKISQGLSNAAALARAIGFVRAEAALSAFQASGSAVALLDRAGEIVMINQAAERMLGTDIAIVNKRFASQSPAATTALDLTIHALIESPDGSLVLPPLVLPRKKGRPILAYPSRAAAISADCLAPCHAVLVLVDLESKMHLVEGTLIRALGLTRAEATLACHLMRGESIEVAASNLGVAYQTSRNHLKSIFHKTRTHRQAELVALLSKLCR
jgi:DNA-binding CsgD family transcriptional regulator